MKRLRILSEQCNLENPEEVRKVIADLKQMRSTKKLLVSIYTGYLEFLGKTWKKPIYKPEEKNPFIPQEKEIDELIASCGSRTATLLQVLKETGARIGEVAKLKWTDYDQERKTVSINDPEKNSRPRILPISDRLIAMLNRMSRDKETIFNVDTHDLRANYCLTLKSIVCPGKTLSAEG